MTNARHVIREKTSKGRNPEVSTLTREDLSIHANPKDSEVELGELVERARLFGQEVVEGDAVLIALILHLLNNLRDTRIGFFS